MAEKFPGITDNEATIRGARIAGKKVRGWPGWPQSGGDDRLMRQSAHRAGGDAYEETRIDLCPYDGATMLFFETIGGSCYRCPSCKHEEDTSRATFSCRCNNCIRMEKGHRADVQTIMRARFGS